MQPNIQSREFWEKRCISCLWSGPKINRRNKINLHPLVLLHCKLAMWNRLTWSSCPYTLNNHAVLEKGLSNLWIHLKNFLQVMPETNTTHFQNKQKTILQSSIKKERTWREKLRVTPSAWEAGKWDLYPWHLSLPSSWTWMINRLQ